MERSRVMKSWQKSRAPSWSSKTRFLSLNWIKCVGWPACNSKFSFSCCLGGNWTCTSLLFRYTLINMPGSVVAISKMTHTRREAFFGLKACRDIQVGSYIKEMCSLMSLDRVGEQGPSIIEATSSQILPSMPRLILGPFHFVNHDCEPNSQVSNNSLYFLSQLMTMIRWPAAIRVESDTIRT